MEVVVQKIFFARSCDSPLWKLFVWLCLLIFFWEGSYAVQSFKRWMKGRREFRRVAGFYLLFTRSPEIPQLEIEIKATQSNLEEIWAWEFVVSIRMQHILQCLRAKPTYVTPGISTNMLQMSNSRASLFFSLKNSGELRSWRAWDRMDGTQEGEG